MHKKRIFIAFIALCFSFIFSLSFSFMVSAKRVSSNDFTIDVGDDSNVYPIIQETTYEDETYNQLTFLVSVNKDREKDNSSTIYNYVWTHVFEVYEEGNLVLTERDVSPSKVNDEYPSDAEFYNRNREVQVYYSKENYLLEGRDFDVSKNYTIKFYNTFTCVDCPNDYEFKEQVLETIELKIVLDKNAPVVDTTGISDMVINKDGYTTVINESKFSVTYSDDLSGIKEAYYVFSNVSYISGGLIYIGDILEREKPVYFNSGDTLIAGIESSSYGEGFLQRTDFFTYFITYYIYIIVEDNAGNIYPYVASFYLYIEKDKNDIEYTGHISEEGTYKSIDLNINPAYETYYSFSDRSFENKSNITSKYTSPVKLGTNDNGVYYLHMYQYDDEGNMLKFTRKYTLDNNAPIINPSTSTIPINNSTLKTISILVNFIDIYITIYIFFSFS